MGGDDIMIDGTKLDFRSSWASFTKRAFNCAAFCPGAFHLRGDGIEPIEYLKEIILGKYSDRPRQTTAGQDRAVRKNGHGIAAELTIGCRHFRHSTGKAKPEGAMTQKCLFFNQGRRGDAPRRRAPVFFVQRGLGHGSAASERNESLDDQAAASGISGPKSGGFDLVEIVPAKGHHQDQPVAEGGLPPGEDLLEARLMASSPHCVVDRGIRGLDR
jgi:hypothetical protein